MVKEKFITIVDFAEPSLLSIQEACEICQVSPEFIMDLIGYDIIQSKQPYPNLLFDLSQLKRMKMAIRLQQDLELNLSGIAIIMDLLNEMDRLRDQIHIIEKHFLNK